MPFRGSPCFHVSPAALFAHVVEKYPKLSGARLERRVKRQKEAPDYLTWCLANSSGVNLPAFT